MSLIDAIPRSAVVIVSRFIVLYMALNTYTRVTPYQFGHRWRRALVRRDVGNVADSYRR